MQQRLGSGCDLFFESLHQSAPVSIRINPQKQTEPDLPRIAWTEYGFFLPERPIFTLDPLFHAGCYYVQEASSMLLEQAVKQSVDLEKPIVALDLCAAPGGKSTHLLSLLNDNSLLVSNEVIKTRAHVLAENIQKWGHENVVVTQNDPEDFQSLPGFFDLIVVDAPCSGEGLFRKDPSAINEWSEQNVALCAQRQQRILANVWPALKEGGMLVYSTCTYNELENEQNLKWLREQHRVEFVKLSLETAWGVEEVQYSGILGYRCYPHRVYGEGFFFSVIRKTEAEESKSFRLKTSLPLASKKTKEQLQNWLTNQNQELLQLSDMLVAIPKEFTFEINVLSHQLNTVLRGTALATQKHDKFVPEHALAISRLLEQPNFPSLELSREETLTYLRKDVLIIGDGMKGFGLVTYQHVPLGWVNFLGNRINNLYPSSWRILMK